MSTENGNTKILVVDDEESIRKLLGARFTREGWKVDFAEDGEVAETKLLAGNYDVVVTDIKMPKKDGFQLIDSLRASGVRCPVIMITGHGEKECAIEAIHKGAFDYLEKPFHMDEIAQVVRRAVENEKLRRENSQLLDKLSKQLEVKTELLQRTTAGETDLLIGKSSHITTIKETINSVAQSFRGDNDPVVLITGESGVGKEVVARYTHHAIFGGNATKTPFVAINCAAFPDNLLESELFGYEKGAFTGATARKLGLFELANGGTLFLDEIGEMDLKMQAKLLRVLQERVIRRLGGTSDIPVRPHIVAATNRDLASGVRDGKFREDLYYRLNTIPVFIAPLRSRTEDIEVLANTFLKELGQGRGKKFTGFSSNAVRAMLSYRWPGNVRELRSVIERAVILERGPELELSQLRQENLQAAKRPEGAPLGSDSASSPSSEASGVVVKFPGNVQLDVASKGLAVVRKELDDQITREILMGSLKKTQGNVSAVARELKLDRANLLRMLKRFGIVPDDYRLNVDSTRRAS